MTLTAYDIRLLKTNSLKFSEYPVKGRGNQTSNGEKVQNLETVENGCDKKYIGDAWYAQTCYPCG